MSQARSTESADETLVQPICSATVAISLPWRALGEGAVQQMTTSNSSTFNADKVSAISLPPMRPLSRYDDHVDQNRQRKHWRTHLRLPDYAHHPK